MTRLLNVRQPCATPSMRFSCSRSATVPLAAARDTKVMLVSKRAPKTPNMRRYCTGCGVGDGSIGVAHGRGHNHITLENLAGFDAEKRRFPRRRIGEFANLHGADFMADAVRDRWIDGVFRNVTLDATVVVVRGIGTQAAALAFHLVRGLPGAGDDFAH